MISVTSISRHSGFHRVINVQRRQAKPTCRILWHFITADMMDQMPILKRLEVLLKAHQEQPPASGVSGVSTLQPLMCQQPPASDVSAASSH
jgi:hypothetical protein